MRSGGFVGELRKPRCGARRKLVSACLGQPRVPGKVDERNRLGLGRSRRQQALAGEAGLHRLDVEGVHARFEVSLEEPRQEVRYLRNDGGRARLDDRPDLVDRPRSVLQWSRHLLGEQPQPAVHRPPKPLADEAAPRGRRRRGQSRYPTHG